MAICWLKGKRVRRQLASAGILLIPCILFILPLEWFTGMHSVCLFKNITGMECYGCGMTRAVLSALHLQFANAFHFNKLFVIVLPILIYIWTITLIKTWPQKTRSDTGF